MKGNGFISLSPLMVGLGEAGARSATSRAYYGAFHIVLELLADFGCPLSRQHKHHVPITCLTYSGHDTGKKAGIILADLQQRRINSDYQLEMRGAGTTAYGQLSIQQAQRIGSLIESFRKSCEADPPLKANFCSNVKAYLARIGR